MAEARIDVVIGSAQAQSGAAVVNRAVDGIKSNFLDLSAKVFVAQQALSKVWSSATQGAQFEETMVRLNRQMAGHHSTAQVMVNDMQAISNHTLAIDKAATLASRALAVGLNPDQIRPFVQAADLLKDQMGTELPTAFDSLVQAAITGRGAILAQIGVYVDLDEEVKQLAVSTNRTTDQITKQEKVMLMTKAMAGQVGEASRKLSDGMISDSVRLKQVEKRYNEFQLSMSQGFKGAVVESLDWLGKLKSWLDTNNPFWAANRVLEEMRPGGPKNPKTQEIYGRAIVQDALGNFARNPPPPTEKPKPLPTSLRGSMLEADTSRQEQALQGELDRTKVMLQAKSALYDTDVQRQILTAEEVVQFKGTIQLQELAKTGETLSLQLAREEAFYASRKKLGFDSTEERISEEQRHKDKVLEINQALMTNVQAFGIASEKITEENAIARGTAQERLGQRLVAQFKSEYDIQEAIRQRDFDAIEVYYQGEFDMANARFAGDEEIATKERAMLREQLAFKLRLTQEEVDRMIFLRKSGDLQGARDIAERADPTLNQRAVEGMVESATAADILKAERANGNFFAGWKRGLQDYSKHRDDAFGMSQIMARETAQAMEQGFQTFFFKGMEGQFRGFKDVLAGVLDFTKQIVSQMAAQMMTVGIIKPGALGLMNLFGDKKTVDLPLTLPLTEDSIGAHRFGGIERFAMGGITSRPRMMALGGRLVEYGEGPQAEAFVPLPDGRTIPVTMRFAGAMPTAVPTGGGPISITMPVNIINQHESAQVETRQSTGANGMPQLDVLIMQAVNKGIAEGRADKTLRSRFRLTPGER